MEALRHLINLLREKWEIDEKVRAVTNAIYDFSEQHEILVAILNVILSFFKWIVHIVTEYFKIIALLFIWYLGATLCFWIGVPILIIAVISLGISKVCGRK